MKKILILIITLLFPLNVLAYSNYIIPGGETLGIEVNNNGIIVVGFYKINNKYNTNDLKLGDIIIGVNDRLEIWSKDRWENFIDTNEDSLSDIADKLFSSNLNV